MYVVVVCIVIKYCKYGEGLQIIHCKIVNWSPLADSNKYNNSSLAPSTLPLPLSGWRIVAARYNDWDVKPEM